MLYDKLSELQPRRSGIRRHRHHRRRRHRHRHRHHHHRWISNNNSISKFYMKRKINSLPTVSRFPLYPCIATSFQTFK